MAINELRDSAEPADALRSLRTSSWRRTLRSTMRSMIWACCAAPGELLIVACAFQYPPRIGLRPARRVQL